MKTKTIFTLVAFCFAVSANAQKPFKELGLDNEVDVLTLSNGRYIEHFTYDTLRQIGSIMFNTVTGKVEYFISEYDLEKQKVASRTKEVSRFLSVDPLTKAYPELTPYQYASNTPIQAIDLDGLEAFFVHGTKSSAARWTENTNSIPTLMKITNNKVYDAKFNWDAPLLNNENDRTIAAYSLAIHVLQNQAEGEGITLIGHSHGGNVAIQAADIIYKRTGQKVNVITIATPAYNDAGDIENPAGSQGIYQHTAIWNDLDVVSGGLAGDDFFTNSPITTNVEVNVDEYYKKITTVSDRDEFGIKTGTYQKTTTDGFGAHSFDVEHPEAIQKAIDKGDVKKQDEIPK